MTPASALQSTDFERNMSALAQGLHVRSIMAYPLETIGPDESPQVFFDRHRALGFDCAPVKWNDRIIGMVYQQDCASGGRSHGVSRATDAMRPLSEVPLVSGDESIAELIRRMRETNEHFWLVLNGTAIDAIVTRSDLWRLPVRLLVIGQMVHLEQLMTWYIRDKCPNNEWLKDLTVERRAKVEAITAEMKSRNEHIDLLDSTNFSDKGTIFKATFQRKDLSQPLRGLTDLRNQLMHARDGEDDAGGIAKFLERYGELENLIRTLCTELKTPQ